MLAHDLALADFHGGDRGLGGALGVVDREVGQLDAERQLVLLVGTRGGLDEADVVEDHLALVYGALVEHLGGDVFRREVEAFAARLFEDGGEQSHLELEGEDVGAGGAALAAFGDDLLDEQAADGQVDRADDHRRPLRAPWKKPSWAWVPAVPPKAAAL